MRRGLASIRSPPATAARSARAPAARGSLRRCGRDAGRDDERHVPDARPPRPQDVACAALRLTAIARPRAPERPYRMNPTRRPEGFVPLVQDLFTKPAPYSTLPDPPELLPSRGGEGLEPIRA